MTKRRKRIIFWALITVAYYTVFFVCMFTVLEEVMIFPSGYQISENCIIVHGQATTGPQIRVVEGSEYLALAIPLPHPEDLNVYELEMTGKSIYSRPLEYPDYYICDWLVYGEVIGTTDEYEECGSGTIPVFASTEVYPIMSLADFLTLETVLFAQFPLGLIVAILLYAAPFIGLLVVVLKPSKRLKE